MRVYIKAEDIIRTGQPLPSETVEAHKGGSLPKELILRNTAPLKKRHSMSFVEALISGQEYIIGKRQYDLTGYAIYATVTPRGDVFPRTRPAKGSERAISKEWPIIIRRKQA